MTHVSDVRFCMLTCDSRPFPGTPWKSREEVVNLQSWTCSGHPCMFEHTVIFERVVFPVSKVKVNEQHANFFSVSLEIFHVEDELT